MPETLRKVSHLRSLYPLLDIQVDGGIGPGESIEAAARAGANVVVAGTSIFKSADPRETIRCLRETVQGSIEKRSGGRKEEDVVLSVDTEDTLRKASY